MGENELIPEGYKIMINGVEIQGPFIMETDVICPARPDFVFLDEPQEVTIIFRAGIDYYLCFSPLPPTQTAKMRMAYNATRRREKQK